MINPLDAVVAWVDSTSGDVVVRSLAGTQPTTVLSITPDMTRAAFSTSVSWKVTFADAFTGLSASNFQLAPSTLGGSPAITGVSPLDSGPVSANWEVTASSGTGGGTLGLNFVNSTGIEAPVVVTNTLVGGTYSFPFPQTLNPPAVFSSLTAPTITTAAGSDFITGSLTAGGYVPTGSVAIGIGGALVTAPIAADGSFSAQVSTAGLASGLYPVRVSYGGDLTATSATASVLMTVTPATASFANLITPTITDGAATATFSGSLTSAAGTPSGIVDLTLDGIMQSATVGSDGSFSATFSTALLPVGSHSVQYSYAGDGVFGPANAIGTSEVQYNVAATTPAAHRRIRAKMLPVTVHLTSASGAPIASRNVAVTAVGIASASFPDQVTPITTLTQIVQFARVGRSYVYKLPIPAGLASGTYILSFMVTGDPVTHSVQFAV